MKTREHRNESLGPLVQSAAWIGTFSRAVNIAFMLRRNDGGTKNGCRKEQEMRFGTTGKVLAIGLLLVAGGIHLVTAQGQFSDATYKGLLFLANFAGALLAAVGIWNDDRWGWILGTMVTGGAVIAYLASRTIGLPGLPVDPAWLEPLGVLSVVAEALFLTQAMAALRSRASSAAGHQRVQTG